MKHSPKILAWVNCYGAWAPDLRHPVETIGYNQYLNTVTAALAALKDRVQAVYVSGGMIDSLDRTECATTLPELSRRLAAAGAGGIEIKADETSVTSISIIREFLETWQAQYLECVPLLFCDQVRYENNAYTLQCLGEQMGIKLPPLRELLIPVPRLDNHPNSTPEKQDEKLRLMKDRGVEAVEKMELDRHSKPASE